MSRAEEAFRKLAEEVTGLRRDVNERLASDDKLTQGAFDKLHDELQQYRQGFLADLDKPLITDLMLFHDSLMWFQSTLIDNALPQATIADHFQFLVDQLLELLQRRDVSPLDTDTTFDRTRQKAVKVAKASTKDADQTIARVLKRGFERHGKVLRPEEVVVYRWREESS